MADRERNVILESYGITVLRFANWELKEDPSKILKVVEIYLSPAPSCFQEGERRMGVVIFHYCRATGTVNRISSQLKEIVAPLSAELISMVKVSTMESVC